MDVFVVDEERFVREVAAESLEEAGLDVAQASSGEAALEALNTSVNMAPTVLVAEVNLGRCRMDGITLALELRRRWPKLGIVVISGHAANLDRASVLAWRERRLMKPFSSEALVRAVCELSDDAARRIHAARRKIG
jgi:CheY-like chemotaxis protein